MSMLRIRCPLREVPKQCQWALVGGTREPVPGAGALSQLPRRADGIQLVLPAADVLITRARLPQSARRHAGAVLAFAVEEQTLGDPDAHQVSWLGTAGSADVLAVVDRPLLRQWHDALETAGVHNYELHCETLMLPWTAGEWTLAWDGREGFVRTGELEGAATDCGAPDAPPLSLRMMLDEAKTRGEAPGAIAVYTTGPAAESGAAPDIEAWQRVLGVALRLAGSWDWRTAPPAAGITLAQERARWRLPPGTRAKLRPAAWIAGIALVVHALALAGDWTRLASEQRGLRKQMETRFRAAFPDAVAVVDPALQMRRKLVDARHAAGQSDAGDFIPMMEKVGAALQGTPGGVVRVVSYEAGRMTLELAAIDEPGVRRIIARLKQAGMQADASRPAGRDGRAAAVLTVRPS